MNYRHSEKFGSVVQSVHGSKWPSCLLCRLRQWNWQTASSYVSKDASREDQLRFESIHVLKYYLATKTQMVGACV